MAAQGESGEHFIWLLIVLFPRSRSHCRANRRLNYSLVHLICHTRRACLLLFGDVDGVAGSSECSAAADR